MQKVEAIKVVMWGLDVGYLAQLRDGTIAFEYAPEFRRGGLDISPIEMPTTTTTTYSSKEVSPTFQGLPGVIADCLPDQFGMVVIHAFFAKQYGISREAVGPLDRLLYIGDRAIGALEFEPALSSPSLHHDHLELRDLVTLAKATLIGKADQLPVEILRVSASSGGRQAKALVDYNPKTGALRHGFVEPQAGYRPCILKFDGTRDGDPANVYGRLEYVYAAIGRSSGIDIPKTYLLEGESEDGPVAHYLIERFDRDSSKQKIFHYASLCGLLLRDFRLKHSASYEDYMQLTRHLTQDHAQVAQAFRRAVFNMMFRNQDDHTKNFGFIMDQAGRWRLAPAFDLTYVYGYGVAASHQMTLNGKDDDFSFEDLLIAGGRHGLKAREVTAIVEQLSAAADLFLSVAEEHGLEEAFAAGVKSRFRRFT